MFFDTHLHLIYPDRLFYPWLADFKALNRPATFDNYQQKAQRLGIQTCLHMEVDIAEDMIRAETAMVEELTLLADSPMHGAISACRPELEGFPAFLDWAQTRPVIKGFRRVLHVVPDGVSQSGLFRENVKRLSGTGLTFDLCVLPSQLSLAAELADHCPDITFVLDHCGVPDVKSGELSPWAENLSELAKRANVIAKISGLIAYGDVDRWKLEDLRPYFDHTVTVFGPNRIVWGSDSPVCNLGGGLETWVAATHALTDGWTAGDRNALFQQNARNIWG